jgi:hypothetical protein
MHFVLRPESRQLDPPCAFLFFISVFHTKPVRWFSAISMVIPKSISITSGSYQFVSGLNASTKPYLLHARKARQFQAAALPEFSDHRRTAYNSCL